MPSIPKFTKCLDLGCKNERSKFNAYCMEHGGRDTFDHRRWNKEGKRKEGVTKYTSKQWRTLRQIQLSKHPLCAGCLNEGRIVPAIHLDHLFPWSQIGEQAFYHNVFQSLCHSHHSIKTTLEQRGIFRLYGIPNRDYTLADYGTMIALQNFQQTET